MTSVYVDSSALLKRVLAVPQSDAVAETLRSHAGRRDLLTSSSLAWLEVWRSLRRASSVIPNLDVAALAAAATVGIAELPLSEDILHSARRVEGAMLRSLDAIHLASALAVDADVVITFDERLAAAARDAGLGCTAPGSD